MAWAEVKDMTKIPYSPRQGGLGVSWVKVSDCRLRGRRASEPCTVQTAHMYSCIWNIHFVYLRKNWTRSSHWLGPHNHFQRNNLLAYRYSSVLWLPSQSSWLQLSHHLFKAKDLKRDKVTKTSSAVIPPASRIPLLLPCFGAFADPMVILTCPGCDTNSPLLVMWNKHQLRTHQSLRDSPILFMGEWIILPNPNTISASWLPRTDVLSEAPHANYLQWGGDSRSESH